MKKIFLMLILTSTIGVLAGCGNKVDKLNEKIEEVLSSETINQEQLDEMFVMYDELSDEKKEEITKYDKIKKYRDVDIEKVNQINIKIDSINTSTAFDEILEINEQVDKLSLNERLLIKRSELNSAMELSNIEKAGMAAVKCIKGSLKNSGSLEVEKIKVIDDLTGDSAYYLVSVDYSATNSFGGRLDDTSFQTISKDFKNPWYGLAMLTGKYEEALKCTSFQKFYLLHKDEPININVDKIMYHINEE